MEEAYSYLLACAQAGESGEGWDLARPDDDTRRIPILERKPSEALDHGQLAFYLCFRRIPKWAITDIGIAAYFMQYPNPDPCARNEVFAQLEREAAERDMAHTLALFHFLLEDNHREQFYEHVYELLARQIHSTQRPVPLADLLHVSPTVRDADEDIPSPTVLDTESSEADFSDT